MYYYECETCDRTFRTQHAAEQHMDAKLHWADDDSFECDTCGKEFRSEHAVNQHMDALDHWAATDDQDEYLCETCEKPFASLNAVEQHMDALDHWTATDYEDEYLCETCEKAFASLNAVEQHMTALGHWAPTIPRADFPPPFAPIQGPILPSQQFAPPAITQRRVLTRCRFCWVDCISASGLTQHLESGNCPYAPHTTRESILDSVRARDPYGRVTNQDIAWGREDMVRYSATQYAFNGGYWECYLCHKEFNSRHALNSHLNSPTHKQKVYSCPNCEKRFVILGGLLNHFESETCGFMRFDTVQQKVTDVIHGQRLLNFP